MRYIPSTQARDPKHFTHVCTWCLKIVRMNMYGGMAVIDGAYRRSGYRYIYIL